MVVGSIHVSRGPLEEAFFGDRACFSVSSVVEFVLSLSKVGVIKLRPSLTLANAHIFILILIYQINLCFLFKIKI